MAIDLFLGPILQWLQQITITSYMFTTLNKETDKSPLVVNIVYDFQNLMANFMIITFILHIHPCEKVIGFFSESNLIEIVRYCITVTSEWVRWRLQSPTFRLFSKPYIRVQIKNTPKLRVTGLCEGNSQSASDAENVSIWWRHHG